MLYIIIFIYLIDVYIMLYIHIHVDMYIYTYYTTIYREYSGVGTFQISIDQGVRRGLGSQCPSWRRGMGLMHHG